MKILHIIPTYLPAPLSSGPIQTIHSLNKELVNMGVDVTVYTSNFDGNKVLNVPISTEVIIDGVRVFYFPLNFKPWYYSIKLHKTLKKNIKNFDLIHISSVFLSFLELGAYYARKFNIPYIVSLHGILMKKPLESKSIKKKLYISIMERKNLRNASAIHFTTKLEEDEYLQANFSFKKSIVIPNSISTKENFSNLEPNFFRKKFNIPENKKIIFFLGRLNWIKGFDILLPAFAEVLKQEKESVLVIAGPDYGYKKEIEKLSKELKIEEKVLYTGTLDGELKISAFRESNVFALTSYSENFSVVTIEAMSVGLPVIITRKIGISSIIKKYNAGIVVEKNVEELSSAILKILHDSLLAKEMGKRGKNLVEMEFNSPKIAKMMISKYNEIIEDN
jgi:glycosyltransferase involved in cell wall biosynthesis